MRGERHSRRVENAAAVAVLRERGYTYSQAAAELALSRSYVSELAVDPGGELVAARRERYRGTCSAGCGRPTSGSDGPGRRRRCTVCARTPRRDG